MGTAKLTYCLPLTMWKGAMAFKKRTPCLVVDFKGLKGFSARQISEAVAHIWPDVAFVKIEFPGLEAFSEVYTERIARALEVAQNREKLAQSIRPHLGGAEIVITSYSIHYTKLYDAFNLAALGVDADVAAQSVHHVDGLCVGGASRLELLVIDEEEQRVPDYGPAEREAIVVFTEVADTQLFAVRLVAGHAVVCREVVGAAFEFVGARLGDDIDVV